MTLPKNMVMIASNVSDRDGIGVEIYQEGKLVIEIFRDDTKRTRTVRLFQEDISLELLEESIQTFKKEIPWDFINSYKFCLVHFCQFLRTPNIIHSQNSLYPST